eukprot:6055919-Alexandrium_andersonii.AAC.1
MNFDCLLELVTAACLLPTAVLDLSKAWSSRLVATGASPGGQGLAYARAPLEVAREWGRVRAHKGDCAA